MKKLVLVILACFLFPLFLHAQTVGVTLNKGNIDDGYTLFAPLQSTETYLLNSCGEVINRWTSSYKPGNTVYLNENGELVRAGRALSDEFPGRPRGDGGIVEIFDWGGNLIWDFEYRTNGRLAHHDALAMPNGNILILAWDKHSRDESLQAGRNPDKLPSDEIWSEHLIEVDPSKPRGQEVVWEWYLWDHLIQDYDPEKDNYGDPATMPGKVDINYTEYTEIADWIHANGIDYNEELDQIMISARNFYELWVIDHSTTTEEARSDNGGISGKGGDLLFRWGNPDAYRQGNFEDKVLFGHHNTQWIKADSEEEGKIMIFNNGAGRPEGAYSTVDVIEPIIDEEGNYVLAENKFLPETLDWSYVDPVPTNFYSSYISGAQLLDNGNLLICEGANGRFYETTREGDRLWEYVNPDSERGILAQGDPPDDDGRADNIMFRAVRYSRDFIGFQDKSLQPGMPIEKNPLACSVITSVWQEEDNLIQIYPNPVSDRLIIHSDRIGSKLEIFNLQNQLILSTMISTPKFEVSLSVPGGIYLVRVDEYARRISVIR